MKQYLTIFSTLALLAFSSPAQDAASKPAPAADIQAGALTTPDDEANAAFLKINLESDTQIKLLRNLARLHRTRADDAAKANQADKSQWENDLAKELNDQADALAKRLNALITQKTASDRPDANPSAPPPASPSTEFVKKLDERFDHLSRDLLAARQEAATNTAQMYTNRVPADFARASAILDQNMQKINQLEQQLFDLELRRLEFNALRRP
jgi:hypothetical protein